MIPVMDCPSMVAPQQSYTDGVVERLTALDAPSDALSNAFLLGVEYGRRWESERLSALAMSKHGRLS